MLSRKVDITVWQAIVYHVLWLLVLGGYSVYIEVQDLLRSVSTIRLMQMYDQMESRGYESIPIPDDTKI